MKKLFVILSSLLLGSCTQTITMAHTEGEAQDVVDTTETTKADVSPAINVPVQSQGSGQTTTPVSPQKIQ